MKPEHDHQEALPDDVLFDDLAGYYYRPGELLVVGDQTVVDQVTERLGGRARGRSESVVSGVTKIRVAADVPSIVGRLRTIPPSARGESRPGLPVFPNHVMRGLGHPSPKPGSTPLPLTAAEAAAKVASEPGQATAKGVRIAVLDTGVSVEPPQNKWLLNTSGGDDLVTQSAGMLDPYCGHGTFIAGILSRYAPGAEIYVDRQFDGMGFVDDIQLAVALSALADTETKVVSLSFGGYTADNLPPPAMEIAISDLRDADIAIVAAAGNEDVTRPSWPAAFKGVVGVAAVDDSGAKACFSNHGSWVDACSDGVDIVSTFVNSPHPAAPQTTTVGCPDASPEPGGFDGFARWSGTSFAAPRVAAAIAREVARNVNPTQAVFSVLQAGTPHPDRGLGVYIS